MHICLVTPSFPPMVDGGVAIATGRLADHLAHQGHSITVLTAPPAEAPPAGTIWRGGRRGRLNIVYHVVPEPRQNPDEVARLEHWIQACHQRQPFDVILGYFVYPAGYLATILAERIGVPVVCSCRGNDVSKDMFMDPATLALVLQRSTRLIFVCDALLHMADTLTPCRHKATIVDNSVDSTRFTPAGASGRPPRAPVVLGTSGLMRWKKGIDLFFPLVQALCTTHDIRIQIAGYGLDDTVNRHIADFLRRHRLRDRVAILGPLPHTRMADALRGMDLYVTTSYQEGMPNGVLEAMACVLPVVATATDGIPQLVEDGVTGYLCPAGALEPLAARCRELIEQPALRQQMGTAGRRRVQQHFHPDRETAEVEAVLQLACNASTRASSGTVHRMLPPKADS